MADPQGIGAADGLRQGVIESIVARPVERDLRDVMASAVACSGPTVTVAASAWSNRSRSCAGAVRYGSAAAFHARSSPASSGKCRSSTSCREASQDQSLPCSITPTTSERNARSSSRCRSEAKAPPPGSDASEPLRPSFTPKPYAHLLSDRGRAQPAHNTPGGQSPLRGRVA
jgi:hypothetical protein